MNKPHLQIKPVIAQEQCDFIKYTKKTNDDLYSE